MLSALDSKLLKEIADIEGEPEGAFNIRKDGAGIKRRSLPGIEIIPKKDKPGIDVLVEANKKGEVHIPVIMTETGKTDLVYNTIDIGENADIELIAGCGIHNSGHGEMRHDGIHTIIVRRGAKLVYSEKHYGEGEGNGKRILNPKTILIVEEGGRAELELIQIRGVDDTFRDTEARIETGGQLLVFERLLTHGEQSAQSDMEVKLMADNSSARIISRSVAQGTSRQIFKPRLIAYGKGRGHVECDSIIMDKAVVRSVPEIWAESAEAELVHEAAIGKIAGDQLIKLMTLGLSEEEAEEAIIKGFLK